MGVVARGFLGWLTCFFLRTYQCNSMRIVTDLGVWVSRAFKDVRGEQHWNLRCEASFVVLLLLYRI